MTHKNIKNAKADMVLNRKNEKDNTKKPNKQTNKQKHTKKKKTIHIFLYENHFLCLSLNFFNIMLELRLRFS